MPHTPSSNPALKPTQAGASQPPLPDNGPIPFPGPRPSHPGPDEAPERLTGPGPADSTRPQWTKPAVDPQTAKASRQLRKVWVLIAGTAVIIFAIVIAPLPGPGFTIFAPIGFAMLASEFMWAKRLANELEHRTGFIEAAAAFFVRTKNWWFLPIAVAIYWGLVFWLNHEKVLNAKYLFPIAGFLFTPVGYLAWRTIVHWHNARRAARAAAASPAAPVDHDATR
ncbi:MAG: PGPGW domain-containing protein [Phycisphaerales bacterium]